MPGILIPDNLQIDDKGQSDQPERQLEAELPVVEPPDPL